MSVWIEIPACRVLAADYPSTSPEFDLLNSQGEPCAQGEPIHRVVRKKDGKVFKMARFMPTELPSRRVIFLEEV